MGELQEAIKRKFAKTDKEGEKEEQARLRVLRKIMKECDEKLGPGQTLLIEAAPSEVGRVLQIMNSPEITGIYEIDQISNTLFEIRQVEWRV